MGIIIGCEGSLIIVNSLPYSNYFKAEEAKTTQAPGEQILMDPQPCNLVATKG